MDKCEKCGFLECRCLDHVAQNYVPKSELRKLVEKWRNESTGSIYKVQTGYCAEELEKLLGGE